MTQCVSRYLAARGLLLLLVGFSAVSCSTGGGLGIITVGDGTVTDADIGVADGSQVRGDAAGETGRPDDSQPAETTVTTEVKDGRGQADVPDVHSPDGGETTVPETIADVPDKEQVCEPTCPGNCGPDGCGGSCGECPSGQPCIDGTCEEPIACESSKDCDEGVCDKGTGVCVDCLEDADCDEGFRCSGKECIPAVECTSDKDCKALGMICDKESGYCVECLADFDCAEDHFCSVEQCVPDVCEPGALTCEATAVWACADNGSQLEFVQACAVGTFCEGGECKPWICEPGTVECQGTVAVTCNELGSGPGTSEDCSALDAVCVGGECLPVFCEDGTVECQEGNVLVTCLELGTKIESVPCPAGTFCDAGKPSCVPWVCVPESAFCSGSIAKQCDALGSAVVKEEDCASAGKICVGGQCAVQVCIPDSVWCVSGQATATCDADGLGYDTTSCGLQQSCWDAGCHPWACLPSQPYCSGTTALVCDALGKGAVGAGQDCAAQGKGCLKGICACVPASCEKAGFQCGNGPDGCGGILVCGVCLPGLACVANKCACVPACTGKECGDNGCGGTCGTCAAGLQCMGGKCACVPSTCQALGVVCGLWDDGCGGTLNCGACQLGWACDKGVCKCTPNCTGKACGSDGCGGSCGTCPFPNDVCESGQCNCKPASCISLGYECGTPSDGCGKTLVCGTCPDGKACNNGKCACAPQCTGKQCGVNGCGGSCGTCGAGKTCSNFQCVDNTTLPGCKTSTSSGCGGCACEACVCATDPFCCWSSWDSLCVSYCTSQCGGCGKPSCGNGLCEGINGENCSTCNSDCICQPGQKCYSGACCTPNCAGKVCGSDGCGGSCGTCTGPNQACQNGKCVCVPKTCGYWECGIVPDGCGGTVDCTGCPAGYACQGTTCVCQPNCAGKSCGSDGCGGTCGPCAGTCYNGTCLTGPGCSTSNTPGCGGCACQECVCEQDAYCCSTAWDGLCTKACIEKCGGCK
jgi:hypothetical protein